MFNGKIHYKWWFSIAMLNYQRVTLPGRCLSNYDWSEDLAVPKCFKCNSNVSKQTQLRTRTSTLQWLGKNISPIFSLMSPASTHRHHRKWMPWSGHPSSCHPKEVRLSPWSESWVAKGEKMWLRRAIWANHLRFSGQFMQFLSQFMVPRHGHWKLGD